MKHGNQNHKVELIDDVGIPERFGAVLRSSPNELDQHEPEMPGRSLQERVTLILEKFHNNLLEHPKGYVAAASVVAVSGLGAVAHRRH